MTKDSDSDEWSGVEEVLERYFMAREAGEDMDLEAECDGDEQLLERVRHALQATPDVFRAAGRATVQSDTVIDDFAIVREIGRGGMGTVYLARQQSLGRDVALKVVDVSNADASARARMKREAELTALLDHPNIVPIYAVGDSGEVPFLAMKLLEGPSLAQVERPWTPERVARVGLELAEALDFAHLRGVVHRDVKPANILLDGATAVFVDFGMARAQSDPTLTQEGKVAGTLRYMAPERLDARSPVLDPRIDVYGLGATLYELLAGHEMFDDESPTALVRSVLLRDPAPLRLKGQYHDLETIIQRALAKEPRRRFGSAREFADDLRRFLNGEPVTSRRLSQTARVLRLVRRYPRVSGALATLFLGTFILVAVIVTQGLEVNADRDRRLETARLDMSLRRHVTARESLELLHRRHPNDADVEAALRVARAEVAFDQLLDAAADNRRNIAPNVVEGFAAVARQASGVRPLVTVALAVALHQAGEVDSAREHLARWSAEDRDARLAATIDALFGGKEPPWRLPAPSGRDPDAVLLSGLVMRLGGCRPGAVLDELLSVNVADREGPRAVLLEAIARADHGQLSAAAKMLRGLARDDAPVAVWRWLANIQLWRNNLTAAGVALERASTDRSSSADYLRLQHEFLVLLQRGDMDAVGARWNELEAESGRSSQQERFLAEIGGKAGYLSAQEASDRLVAAAADELSPYARQGLIADQVEVTGWQTPGADELNRQVVADSEEGKAHEGLLARWRDAAAGLTHPLSKARAQTWIARSLCNTGHESDFCQGIELFAVTCRETPGRPRPALEFVRALRRMPPTEDLHVRRYYCLQAVAAVDEVLARVDSGMLRLEDDYAHDLRSYGWMMSYNAENFVGAAVRLPAVEHGLSPHMLAPAQANARDAMKLLESFRKR